MAPGLGQTVEECEPGARSRVVEIGRGNVGNPDDEVSCLVGLDRHGEFVGVRGVLDHVGDELGHQEVRF